MTPSRRLARSIACLAAIFLCAFSLYLRTLHAAGVEPAILPSAHFSLAPSSAITAPLLLAGEQISVWRADLEQRLLLSGDVSVSLGYRQMKAENAAVWLTPSHESGERTFDVAIYLAGNVQVREGSTSRATTTYGPELLVTTRISQEAPQLAGMPVSQSREDSPIVKRGNELRQELLTRPAAPAHIPLITITDAEHALQNGWIARTPENRIIAGPGEIQVVRDEHGNIIPGAIPPPATRPAKPRPTIFATGDDIRTQTLGDELVTIVPGAYLLYNTQDGKPPIEFRAQRMVLFSPNPRENTTRPATASKPATATAATKPNAAEITQYVTGIYLEGDVTFDQGDQVMVRAERIYYDFTSQRAIMLDATLASVDTLRNVPVYMRATEIRQLARGEFAAKKATFSTSEFHTPHYHIGASSAYLRDVTPPPYQPPGQAIAQPAGPLDIGLGQGNFEDKTFQFEAKDATINVAGAPIFYWPYIAGDTSKNIIPLRTIRISNSKTYGPSVLTDWDLFSLLGQPEPQGVHADLNLDYFGKRGPAGGVQANWNLDDDHGVLRSYGLFDQGTDRLGVDRNNIIPSQEARGRATIRDQRDLGDGFTLQLEASYISDPTFLEQFFQQEFDAEKEHETSIYLKKQGETDAFTFLGKVNLMDFSTIADQVDDQFTTDKKPEVKYWRIGDSILDMFTYYSESGAANVHTDITDFTPKDLGLVPSFLGTPANTVPIVFAKGSVPATDPNLGNYFNTKFRDMLRAEGFTTSDVLRADTRHELDMPLQLGDAKVTPYVTGRFTFWDQDFPDTSTPNGGGSGSTSRVYGAAGIRSSMSFWRVYNDVNSTFWDLHRIRHIIEPQFNIFVADDNVDRRDLQPFDRDVEGITGASGSQVVLSQKWQTKRGGEGQWRDVDWITLDLSWNQFWNRDKTSVNPDLQDNPSVAGTAPFFQTEPARGFYFASRPELSLAQNSIALDGTWRVGERVRFLGDANYSIDNHRISQFSAGLAVDQTNSLSYFIGNRYIRDIFLEQWLSPVQSVNLTSDEWTLAMDYHLTQKYELIAAESYDIEQRSNVLSSITIIRRFPRLITALTATYDNNDGDFRFSFTAWPEGMPAANIRGIQPTDAYGR